VQKSFKKGFDEELAIKKEVGVRSQSRESELRKWTAITSAATHHSLLLRHR
jgi:hypothetical protein